MEEKRGAKRRGDGNARKKERGGGRRRKKRRENEQCASGEAPGAGAIWGATGWCLVRDGAATGHQADHLSPGTQPASGAVARPRAEVTVTLCPSRYGPTDVSGHRAVQHGAKSAAEVGIGRLRLLAGASGFAPQLPGCGPGCQSQGSQVRVVRSRWHGRALTFSPS